MISIITTAFNNSEYIEECLDSIINSAKSIEFEIIVGIDNCEKTLFKCFELSRKYPINVKFLFFLNHVGTYVIRNTLVTEAKFQKLLFFDSDDIMTDVLIESVSNSLDVYEHIRYKYHTFNGLFTENIKNNPTPTNHFHTGTFGILKDVFLNTNGFEPWVCAADGEFYWRVIKNKIRSKDLDILGLFYRRHGNNLTINEKTNMGSPLRKMYHNLKEKKIINNQYLPLPKLEISKFKNINDIDLDTIIKTNRFYETSIIIPTYNNTEYIDECLSSILNSGKNHNIEILVGIDGCEKTLNHIKRKTYPDFVKFYYFNSNNGPYDIKNSLVQISNSDNLLFFDSDDIMSDTTITDVINNIDNYDVIKLKLNNYVNGKITNNKINYGEGVFAIKKSIFISMNGFEPWRVAADSDFMGRISKRNFRTYYTKNIAFLYRQHPTSLTKRLDTGMSSKLRGGYAQASKMKKGDGNPPFLHTRRFELVTTETFQVTKDFDYQKEIRNQKLDKIFNKTVRKVVDVVEEKKQDPIILDGLSFLQKTKVNEPRIIKTNNRQDLLDNKNGTTKNTIKEMFSIKPNHREGKNFINLGGKYIK